MAINSSLLGQTSGGYSTLLTISDESEMKISIGCRPYIVYESQFELKSIELALT